MQNNLKYVEELKVKYSTLYFKIADCFNEMSDYSVKRFEDGNCYYKVNIGTLKTLVDKLDNYSIDSCKRGGLLNLLSASPSTSSIESYINTNKSKLSQLENCTKCVCFSCIKDCNFNPCGECRLGSHLISCNKVTSNIRVFDSYKVPLINNDTGAENTYDVLCIIELEEDNKYIFLENICETEDKLILEYNTTIRGIAYGEITDENLFNKLVKIYKDSGL